MAAIEHEQKSEMHKPTLVRRAVLSGGSAEGMETELGKLSFVCLGKVLVRC